MRPSTAISLVLTIVTGVGSAGCSSVLITPEALRLRAAESPRHDTALRLWKVTIDVANEFLASPYRETLPAGQFELQGDGMYFVTDNASFPVAVRVTRMGTLFKRLGVAGQERSWGFVVGRCGRGSRIHANTFFRDKGGGWRHPVRCADLLLHETTHVVFEHGTVSFWKGVAYYLEAIFLLRYRRHSAERVPFTTTEEFRSWVRETDPWTRRPKAARREDRRREGPVLAAPKAGGPSSLEPAVPAG